MDMSDEGHRPRGLKKIFMENPFVPMGTVAVVLSLALGLKNMSTGNTAASQAMMRSRVGSQLFVVGALVASAVYLSVKQHLDKEKEAK